MIRRKNLMVDSYSSTENRLKFDSEAVVFYLSWLSSLVMKEDFSVLGGHILHLCSQIFLY